MKGIESNQYAAERRQAIALVIEEKTRASVLELSKRLSVSEVTIRKDLALLDVYGRVARLLLNLAVERDGKLAIPEKLTQQEIAERVGASRDMVSRIFRDLTAGGNITVESRHITINKKPPARW